MFFSTCLTIQADWHIWPVIVPAKMVHLISLHVIMKTILLWTCTNKHFYGSSWQILILVVNSLCGQWKLRATYLLPLLWWRLKSLASQLFHQSSASRAFVRGIHQWPVKSHTQIASNVENVSIWCVIMQYHLQNISHLIYRKTLNRNFRNSFSCYRFTLFTTEYVFLTQIKTWIIYK